MKVCCLANNKFKDARMKITACFFAIFFFSYQGFCQGFSSRPRVVISSDFPPIDVIPGTFNYGAPEKKSDPDDIQSMVRFLVYSNDFEILGLIAGSGTLANIANKQNIFDILDLYDKVDDNLRRHDPAYPLPDDLRKITKQGLSGTYARTWTEIIGEGKDSEASDYLIDLLRQPDPAPIWFCFWGGTQELAQALWRIQKHSEPKQLKDIISKIRIFMIAQQDGTGQWLIDNFPDMLILVMQKAYKGFFYYGLGADQKLGDSAWVSKNIRSSHGPLGEIYPESGWDHTKKGVIEGDTPSFLYVLSGAMGLSDPEKPWYGGWGGNFKADSIKKNLWIDSDKGPEAISEWQYSRQNDFEARMDRCVKIPSRSNHNPIAIISKNTTKDIIHIDANPGQQLSLSALGSHDPDGNSVTYSWMYYKDASTYSGLLNFNDSKKSKLSFAVPKDAAGSIIHIILEVKDNGRPRLSSFRRVVVTVGL